MQKIKEKIQTYKINEDQIETNKTKLINEFKLLREKLEEVKNYYSLKFQQIEEDLKSLHDKDEMILKNIDESNKTTMDTLSDITVILNNHKESINKISEFGFNSSNEQTPTING